MPSFWEIRRVWRMSLPRCLWLFLITARVVLIDPIVSLCSWPLPTWCDNWSKGCCSRERSRGAIYGMNSWSRMLILVDFWMDPVFRVTMFGPKVFPIMLELKIDLLLLPICNCSKPWWGQLRRNRSWSKPKTLNPKPFDGINHLNPKPEAVKRRQQPHRRQESSILDSSKLQHDSVRVHVCHRVDATL